MGSTHEGTIGTVGDLPGYVEEYRAVFGTGEITLDQVADAIAAFERTVVTTDSPCDWQSAGHRLGASAYYGWQPARVPGDVVSPTGPTSGEPNQPFLRAGLDASLNYRALDLSALFLRGVDDKAVNAVPAGQDDDHTGGFIELT
jgi:hypothetical protein